MHTGDDGGGDDGGSNVDAPDDAVTKVYMDAAGCYAGLACAGAGVQLVNKAVCNGGCWVTCTSDLPFTDQTTPSKACKDWGGHLAPIRSAADEACVSNVLFPSQASWIGFEQASSTTLLGNWSWNSDGIAPAYTHWASGQPNDVDGTESNEEQCAMMSTIGTWQDVPCTGQALFRFSCRHD